MTISNDHHLPAGHTLTVTITVGISHVQQIEDPTIAAMVTNTAPVVFGPYMLPRNFRVQNDGNTTVAIAEADSGILTSAQAATVADIPVVDQNDSATVWNDEGTLKVSTAP